jgi:hypothetical protein
MAMATVNDELAQAVKAVDKVNVKAEKTEKVIERC